MPLIPIALATGWSAGVLFLLGLLPGPLSVKLNPMSVTLGALVIAISTEFSVLLSARYRQEREAGAPPARAMELTYTSTGAAVLASGATAIAGFAVLIASDIRMLRDFGVLTVVDLSVSLLGVMLVLPAALVWAEQHGPFGLRDLNLPLLRELRAAAGSSGSPPRLGRCAGVRSASCAAMPEDRFGDLGRPDGRSAAERFEEEDRLRRSRTCRRARPRCRGPATATPGWSGILALMGIGVLLVTTTLPDAGEGLRGPAGARWCPTSRPRWPRETWRATPTCAKGNDSERRPVPACQVRSEEVVNVCELRRRPLVLTFLVTAARTASRRWTASSGSARVPGRGLRGGLWAATSARRSEQIVRRRGWGCPWRGPGQRGGEPLRRGRVPHHRLLAAGGRVARPSSATSPRPSCGPRQQAERG